MKKIDLERTLGILANLGIVAGIIFLAVELDQNNDLLEAQARQFRQELFRNALDQYSQNPIALSAAVKSANGERLTQEERLVLQYTNIGVLTNWRFIYDEYREGLLELDAIPITVWSRIFHEQPGLQDQWAVYSADQHESEFVNWMEDNIVNDDAQR